MTSVSEVEPWPVEGENMNNLIVTEDHNPIEEDSDIPLKEGYLFPENGGKTELPIICFEEWKKMAQEQDDSYEQEHDNYIFIKFRNEADVDVKQFQNVPNEDDMPSGSSTALTYEDGYDSEDYIDLKPLSNTRPVAVQEQLPVNLGADGESDIYERDENEILDGWHRFLIHQQIRNLNRDEELRNFDGETDSFILQLMQELEPMNFDLHGDFLNNEKATEPLYPCSKVVKSLCEICLEDNIDTRERLCCKVPVCESCLKEYLKSSVEQRNVRIQCINCDSYVHRDEILALLPQDVKEKYYRFLLDENKDPDVRTCPRCCLLQKREDIVLESSSISPKKKKEKKSLGLKVICSKCSLAWCFNCHAPWHENIKCKEFKKGDKLVKTWAKEHSYGQKNAVRCPSCKVFIQRKSGCDHMVCKNCKTNFCYNCGGRYMQMKLIGKHSDRLSPFGCKYNFMQDTPVARRAIRGSVFVGKLLGGVLLGGLIVAAAAIFVGGSPIIVPSYFGLKYYNHRKRLKFMKTYRKQRKAAEKLQYAMPKEQVHSKTEDIFRDMELGLAYHDVSDAMTSTESNSSDDHHGSTEVKVWVHSENEDKELDNNMEEQHASKGLHDNTVTTAEVKMEDNVVVLHVTTSNKTNSGEVTNSDPKDDGNSKIDGKKDEDKDEVDKNENNEEGSGEINVESQGCFVKILGKLPVKWEKEEDIEGKLKENGIHVSVKPAIVKDKKRKIGTRRCRNHYDQSEKGEHMVKVETAEKTVIGNDSVDENLTTEIQNSKQVCDLVDPYLGQVSMETFDTCF